MLHQSRGEAETPLLSQSCGWDFGLPHRDIKFRLISMVPCGVGGAISRALPPNTRPQGSSVSLLPRQWGQQTFSDFDSCEAGLHLGKIKFTRDMGAGPVVPNLGHIISVKPTLGVDPVFPLTLRTHQENPGLSHLCCAWRGQAYCCSLVSVAFVGLRLPRQSVMEWLLFMCVFSERCLSSL